MKELRGYQKKAIEELRSHMKAGVREMLLAMATGSGKTLTTAHMLGTSAQRDIRSLFIVHRRELILQSSQAFSEMGVGHGIIAAGFEPTPDPMVQVAGIQSLSRRLDSVASPGLVIWDECHHTAANTWAKVYSRFPRAFHIGLTATPARLDGQGLGKFFKLIVNGPPTAWLIKQGFLSPYKLFAPGGLFIDEVPTRASDLDALCNRPTLIGNAVREYQRYTPGAPAIAFCVSISHSKRTAAQFREAGYKFHHIDGKTSDTVRDQLIADLAAGEIHGLCNVDLFGEGLDIPRLHTVLLMRPTTSLSLHRQMIGRALRPAQGKSHATILDFAGNTQRLGLPDEPIEWSLQGRTPIPKNPVRICPACYAANRSGRAECFNCHSIFPIEHSPREIDEKDGDLEEINIAAIAARRARIREQAQARTYEALCELGRQRGYRHPAQWAQYIIRGRGGR